jgi:MoxR-like ATPase
MDLTHVGLDARGQMAGASRRVLEDASRAAELFESLVANIARVVQGNDEAIRLAVTCLVAGGHLLVEDVPGVGKTSLGKALSASVSCHHRRIQFTSDLLPSDVTGVNVFDVTKASFEFRPGPIFANIVLGDEINRTPPKTQSALLESMEERQVTVDGVTYRLPDPFMVIATQNPLEHEGTYPLPVSQLDRFLLRIQIGYPDAESEANMLEAHGVSEPLEVLQPVATPEDVIALAARARGVHTSPLIQRYIVEIANATRAHPAVVLGMSPRAALALQRAARARAVLEGRDFVSPDDVKAMAPSVIGHRLELRGAAGRGRDRGPVMSVLDEVLHEVPLPELPVPGR